MDYDELNARYQKLLEENQHLKAENEKYRRRLGLEMPVRPLDGNHNTNPDPNNLKNEPAIVSGSSPDTKIKLFMSLFKGRDDVYAKRWQSKKGKSGYSPSCLHEWSVGICHKPKMKCSKCNNRNYAPLSPEVIDKHLRGKHVIGIYPMLTDETCYFLVIDFDGEGWEKDISVIREICTKMEIPVAVERSRSGEGAHLWFFFVDKVSSVKARKFGTAILTQAMTARHELKFKTYDRLFPSQDTLQKGGLGNLIALPLQLKARDDHNSVFIDENFVPYADQWRFLSSLRKLPENEINLYTAKLCGENELGDLRESEDEEGKPWEKRAVNRTFDASDFPDAVQLIKANMLYLRKNGFSHQALNAIKRLAAFKNPDFYKAQAMRLPTFDKPRIISLSDETSGYLGLPRGCEIDLARLLDSHQVDIGWADETCSGRPVDVRFNGELQDEQADAVRAMLKFDNGVLSATTGFGKTVIGAKLISARKVNTLVLVNSRQLLEQWKDRLNRFLHINESLPADDTPKRRRKKSRTVIGQLGAGKNSLNGIVDIAIMQSLVRGDEVKDYVRNYGMVIVDECHHVPAFSFEKILKSVTAKYVYGLTATPVRQDGHHPIIFMQCGPIRYKVDARKQADKRPFDHYVIPRFTSFRKPVTQDEKEWTIGEIYSEISTSELRNKLIIDDVAKSVEEGRNPLILTERTAHVEILANALKEFLPNVVTLTGGMSAKERKATMDKLAAIPEGNSIVLVATGRFIGEGFDEPRLDTLFLAMPVAWKGTVQQYAGRLHRLYQHKSEVQIYDYVDVHVGVLERMYQKRLKGYAAIGYAAKGDSRPFETINAIFNNNNFLPVFNNDVLSAKNEIIIVSPYVRRRRLAQMLNTLVNAVKNGARVTVITRPVTDYRERDRVSVQEMIASLKNSGTGVILKPNIHQKFAVIDQRIVWYGSINLLSFGSAEESMMRLDSLNIASELTGTIVNESEEVHNITSCE